MRSCGSFRRVSAALVVLCGLAMLAWGLAGEAAAGEGLAFSRKKYLSCSSACHGTKLLAAGSRQNPV